MPPPNDVGLIGIEVLNAARRWARARVILRQLLDSKKASQAQKSRASAQYERANRELEMLVGRLEHAMLLSGTVAPPVRRSTASPILQGILRTLAETGARALHETLNGPESPRSTPKPGETQVIDSELDD